jgi:hypothetical protein
LRHARRICAELPRPHIGNAVVHGFLGDRESLELDGQFAYPSPQKVKGIHRCRASKIVIENRHQNHIGSR